MQQFTAATIGISSDCSTVLLWFFFVSLRFACNTFAGDDCNSSKVELIEWTRIPNEHLHCDSESSFSNRMFQRIDPFQRIANTIHMKATNDDLLHNSQDELWMESITCRLLALTECDASYRCHFNFRIEVQCVYIIFYYFDNEHRHHVGVTVVYRAHSAHSTVDRCVRESYKRSSGRRVCNRVCVFERLLWCERCTITFVSHFLFGDRIYSSKRKINNWIARVCLCVLRTHVYRLRSHLRNSSFFISIFRSLYRPNTRSIAEHFVYFSCIRLISTFPIQCFSASRNSHNSIRLWRINEQSDKKNISIRTGNKITRKWWRIVWPTCERYVIYFVEFPIDIICWFSISNESTMCFCDSFAIYQRCTPTHTQSSISKPTKMKNKLTKFSRM